MREIIFLLSLLVGFVVFGIGIFVCFVGMLGVGQGITGDCLIPLAGFVTVLWILGIAVYVAVKRG